MPFYNDFAKSLYTAIADHDPQLAKDLITICKGNPKISSVLTSLDSDNIGFLQYSLQFQSEELAMIFLEAAKKSRLVFFTYTHQAKSILSYATESQFPNIVKAIIEQAATFEFADTTDRNFIDFYFTQDSNGETPLHIAARQGNMEIVKIFLELLTENNKLQNHLHKARSDGFTALRLAANLVVEHEENYQLLIELINCGAMIDASDGKRSVFDIIKSYSSDLQIKIYRALTNKLQQASLFELYSKEVTKNNPPSHLVSVFFHISDSLQQRVINYLELENKSEAYNTYNSVKRDQIVSAEANGEITITEAPRDAKGYYPTTVTEQFVLRDMPEALKLKIPKYISTIHEATEEAARSNPNESGYDLSLITVVYNRNKPHKSATTSNVVGQNDDLLNQDRITLTSLIEDIQTYLNDLAERPRIRTSNRELIVIMSILMWTVLLGSVAYLAYETDKWSRLADAEENKNWGSFSFDEFQYDVNKFGGYSMGAIMGGLGGAALIGFLQYHVFNTGWSPATSISSTEPHWQSILCSLQNDVLGKLSALQFRQSTNDKNLLPISTAEVTTLTQYRESLNSSKSIHEAVALFTNIKTALESLRKNMNRTSKPLSLFFTAPKKPAECVIDVKMDTEATETTSLLHHQKNNKRHR